MSLYICRGVRADEEGQNYVFLTLTFWPKCKNKLNFQHGSKNHIVNRKKNKYFFCLTVLTTCPPPPYYCPSLLITCLRDFERFRYNVLLHRQMWRHRQCNHSWHMSRLYFHVCSFVVFLLSFCVFFLLMLSTYIVIWFKQQNYCDQNGDI